jgi:uncharacterized protein (DUF697 family)
VSLEDYKDVVDRVLAGDYDDASEEERRAAVDKIVRLSAIAAGAVAFQPLPLLDVLLISPIQIAMVQAIGRIHGHRLDEKSILEMLSTFGASILAQNVILSAVKFVPFFGWLTAISMAYALTWAVGEVSDYYFREGRGASSEDLKARFQSVYREKKAEKEASLKKAGGDRLKDRLAQLQEALDAGLLTQEEFDQKRRDILAAV